MNWYLKVLSQYVDFSGRARRKEYWMFTLFHTIAIILLLLVSILLNDTINNFLIAPWLIGIYVLLTIVPTLAVSVRRMHDIGKSGAWYLINFIPYLGSFWFLILTCMEGQAKPNQWGEDPKSKSRDSIIDQIGKE